jgi:Protein of unknown function (DUF2889)
MTAAPAGRVTPPRRPGSIRRTTTLDMLRPEGMDGPLVFAGRARDLLTDAEGAGQVVDHAQLSAVLDGAGRLRQLRTFPVVAGLSRLDGRLVGAGFRTAVTRHLPVPYGAGSPLHQLLDELPVGRVISGFAVTRRRGRSGPGRPDVCIGWRTGGTALTSLRVLGHAPDPRMAIAEPFVDETDRLAWHTRSALPLAAMRRHRRLDVTAGDVLEVSAMFFDTHVDDDGVERTLHQYTLEAHVDRASHTVLDVTATPWVLPFAECPFAAATAARIVGQPAGRLREYVSLEYWGPTTCTHLNDLLRTLADVPHLARKIADADGDPSSATS